MLPFQTDDFDEALCHARQRSFATRKPAMILLDRVRARLYVLVGPHKDFLEGRPIVVSIDANGVETVGG